MKIQLKGTGKKFNTEWIFRELSYTFENDRAVAVLGRNGSGKSTLLQIIAGSLHPTAGTITYQQNGDNIPVENVFQHLSIVAPYQELIEEFTLREMVEFHFHFKKPLPGFPVEDVIRRTGFRDPGLKTIRQFSSGMKQRVKILLALLSDVSVVLLDEPTMNLDNAGSEWYLELIHETIKNRVVVVCSNLQARETAFCKDQLFIEEYKKPLRS